MACMTLRCASGKGCVLPIGVPVFPEDVGHLPGGGYGEHGSSPAVQRASDTGQSLAGEVQILGRGGELAMAEEFLNGVRIDAILQEMGGETMPEGMDAFAMGNPGLETGGGVDLLRRGDVQRGVSVNRGEKPDRGTIERGVFLQFFQEALGKERVAVLVALALFDANGHAGNIEVLVGFKRTTSLTLRPAE